MRTALTIDGGEPKTKQVDNKLNIPAGATGIGFSLIEISCLENCGYLNLVVERQGELDLSVYRTSLITLCPYKVIYKHEWR